MLDTVRIGLHVEGVTLGGLYKQGWRVGTVSDARGRSDAWASIEAGPVRLHYGAGFAWLVAETSLPRLVLNDNSELLTWEQVQVGLSQVHDIACGCVGLALPAVEGWKWSRLDAVWAWPCEPLPYIQALRFVRLPRTWPRRYESSIDYLTRGRRVRLRLYDKSAEAGHDVVLRTRLERQVRRREALGKRLGSQVADLSAILVRGLLSDALATLGLDEPVPSMLAARQSLIACHGKRRGYNLWCRLLDAVACGGWASDLRADTRRRYERQLRQAGVRALSLDGQLPALRVPTC